MPTCTLQVRLDADLRKEADELFTSAGMDLSTAVRLFLRQSVIRRRLPFEVIVRNPGPIQGGPNHRDPAEAASPAGSDEATGPERPTPDRKLPPWAGTAVPFIRVAPGMNHDLESIREDIGRGIAAELAERGFLMASEA